MAPLTERVLGSKILGALTSPHGVDRYLELVNPMWAATEVRARVVEVVRETSGEHPVATVRLQPTRTWRGHRAGQYVQVGIEVPGARRTTRIFSISSAESGPGEEFTITVRAHAEGLVSKYLVHEAQPGLTVHLSQAEGEFTLHESPATPSNNHLLYITGGSGITPAMSHVRTLLRDGYDGRANRKVTFLHYARSAEDQIFAEELQRIAWGDNHVSVHLRYGEDTFTEAALRRLVPDFERTDTWACGPAPMMELVSAAYDGSPRLRTEFFKLGARGASGTAGGEVVFERSGAQAANTGDSILEQAEAAGLTPEFGCRMGICFSCTARKCEGTVRNVLTGEESSLPDEEIRVCVSAPVGDVVVDL
ncbi:Ferredoxin-NADP reductase [Nocardioides scoriae]|uniref:Ferredoxin-NADP reductase n=1 Tax=Nocardioides scoriae TaxID=642780 RepID=A0A1H1XX04_9ACTN|nr:iron-sulfur cluster-binding domain-containing protein [Nocardioides scoriae]SDT13551.1 Ferredoxin-NADP reductase [Nocardioides scoriae]